MDKISNFHLHYVIMSIHERQFDNNCGTSVHSVVWILLEVKLIRIDQSFVHFSWVFRS